MAPYVGAVTGIFVSHATADARLVEEFVEEVLRGCGVTDDQLFVSSIAELGVPSGTDLLHHVRERVGDAGLVVAIVTPTYLTRPVCVGELGAAWAVTGKLFPLLAMGIDRDRDLDGVLKGVRVDYLDDEEALDELHVRLGELLAAHSDTRKWTRKKRRWLQKVSDLVAGLPTPDIVSPAQFAQLKAAHDDLGAALEDAEGEVDRLRTQLERLKNAKTREEVESVLLPEDDIERFYLLVKTARSALSEVPKIVRIAIAHQLAKTDFTWPNGFDEPDRLREAEEAVRDGILEDEGIRLSPNESFRLVNEARIAAGTLHQELSDGFEPDFYNWFDREYGLPADMTMGAVWNALFPRL